MAAARLPLAVINGGVESYNLQQSIEHFYRDALTHYQPVVVTLQAANDVALLLTYRESWTPDSTWAPYRLNIPFLLGSSATLHSLMALKERLVGTSSEGGARVYPPEQM